METDRCFHSSPLLPPITCADAVYFPSNQPSSLILCFVCGLSLISSHLRGGSPLLEQEAGEEEAGEEEAGERFPLSGSAGWWHIWSPLLSRLSLDGVCIPSSLLGTMAIIQDGAVAKAVECAANNKNIFMPLTPALQTQSQGLEPSRGSTLLLCPPCVKHHHHSNSWFFVFLVFLRESSA